MFEHLGGVSPETYAIHGGFDPALSQGAVKVPVFLTSTYVAKTAEELELAFKQAYGIGMEPSNPDILVYSRVVNPNKEIFENRIAKFGGAESAALLSSGMAAISSICLSFLRPGDSALIGKPVYGGSDFLFNKFMPGFNVDFEEFMVTDRPDAVLEKVSKVKNLKLVFIETPANPTLELADLSGIIRAIRSVHADVIIAVDNTLLGPVFQKAMTFGADLSVYSATKMIGGHSDLVAGLVLGRSDLIQAIKGTRTILGSIAGPWTAWMLSRSLETLKVRAEAAEAKAKKVWQFLVTHPQVKEVFYPGHMKNEEQNRRFKELCSGSGSLMSFRVEGGKSSAYSILNHLKVIKLAVSLGGTESLAEHPRTHTHSDVSPQDQDRFGISDDLIRLSVGLEDADDLIADLQRAFKATYPNETK